MLCDTVRGSHLDLFDRCQLAYKFTVHDSIVPDIRVPKWAMLGWVMHKVFDLAISTGQDAAPLFQNVVRNYRELAREEWASSYPNVPLDDKDIPSISPADMGRALSMLRNFRSFRSIVQDADRVITEMPFEIVLDHEGTIKLRGRIDVVITRGQRMQIVDYKTSKPNWEHKSVPKQLLRYVIAIAVIHNIPVSTIEAVLFNVESGNVLRKTWTADDANAMIASIVRRIEHIRSTHPSKAQANVGSHCYTLCQYHIRCPDYREARR